MQELHHKDQMLMAHPMKLVLLVVVVAYRTQAFVVRLCERRHFEHPLSGMSNEVITQAADFIEERVLPKDAVVFLTCGVQRAPFEDALMRAFPGRTTQWSRFEPGFKDSLEADLASNVRTVIVVVGAPEKKAQCLRQFLSDIVFVSYSDLIVFHNGPEMLKDDELAALNDTCSLCRRRPVLLVSSATIERNRTAMSGASVFSRMCYLSNRISGTRVTLPAEDKEITFVCVQGKIQLDHEGEECGPREFKIIFTALRAQNATLKFNSYRVTHFATLSTYTGVSDVLVRRMMWNSATFKLFQLPPILEYRADTFYTWRDGVSSEISFFAVFTHSRSFFLLTLISFLAFWVVLLIGKCFEFGDTCPDGWSALFLIASFFSVSTSMDSGRHGRSPLRSWLFRKVFLLVWVIATLPLSSYLRGELTSRLSVVLPPDYIDTLEEVETALDRDELTPCVFTVFERYELVVNGTPTYRETLYTKLRHALETKKQFEIGLVTGTTFDCIECARRTGFACFSNTLHDCDKAAYSRDYVESKERMNIAMSTFLIRKDYAHAQVLSNLLRRLQETGFGSTYADWRTCGPEKVFIDNSRENVGNADPPQLYEHSAFLGSFACLLLFSILVFFLELALGKRITQWRPSG